MTVFKILTSDIVNQIKQNTVTIESSYNIVKI